MKRLLVAAAFLAAMSTLTWASPVPQKNKFTGPVQIESGPVCGNTSATGTQFTLEPCTDNTDVVKDCTTGTLLNLTELTGDRYVVRCINTGANATMLYSAAKLLLSENVSYDSNPTAGTFRGLDVRGTTTVASAGVGGGSQIGVNLLHNSDFSSWISPTDATDWGDTHLCDGTEGGMDTCESRTTTYHTSPYALNLTATDTSDGSIVQSRPGRAGTYLDLAYNTTYAIDLWYRSAVGDSSHHLSWSVWEFTNPTDISPAQTLRSSTGGNPGSWSVNESTCTLTNGTYPYFAMDGDSTYHEFTTTFTTRAGSGTFKAALVLCNGGSGIAGGDVFADDVELGLPGQNIDTGLTLRGIDESLWTVNPTATSEGDTITLTEITGVDATPTVKPSTHTDSTVAVTEAAGLKAGLALDSSANSGTFTATTTYGAKITKPEFGTTRYGAYVTGVTALDPGSDGTAEYKFVGDPDGTCADGEVLTQSNADGGIVCAPSGAGGCSSTLSIYTETVLASGTLSVDTSSISVSSIPSSYDAIIVRLTTRADTSALEEQVRMELNGDTTNGNYLYIQQYATNSGSGGTTGDNRPWIGKIPAASATANYFGAVLAEIPNYASTSFSKNVISLSGERSDSTTLDVSDRYYQWDNTAAVSSLTLLPETSGKKFKAGTAYAISARGAVTVCIP